MDRKFAHLPPLQCLRAFLAVAECRSFTEAARMLGLTQTAVSHQIAQLEEHVGQRLFKRNRQGADLTGAGQTLLPTIEFGLQTLHRGIDAIMPRRIKTAVTVSTTPEFGSQWLAPRLERLLQDDPEISVQLNLEYRRADLLGGEADICIWLGPGGAGLRAVPLGLEEEFVVSSPELDASMPRFNAIASVPLLRYAGARHTVLDWRRWYEQVGFAEVEQAPKFDDLEFGQEYPTFGEMIGACREGEGIALVRSSLVEDDIAKGRLVRCFYEGVASDLQYHVVVSADRDLSEPVAALRAWLLGQARHRA